MGVYESFLGVDLNVLPVLISCNREVRPFPDLGGVAPGDFWRLGFGAMGGFLVGVDVARGPDVVNLAYKSKRYGSLYASIVKCV